MITAINWLTLELLKKMYEWPEIVKILSSGQGKWIVIPTGEERPFDGTAYVGERGAKRAAKFWLN